MDPVSLPKLALKLPPRQRRKSVIPWQSANSAMLALQVMELHNQKAIKTRVSSALLEPQKILIKKHEFCGRVGLKTWCLNHLFNLKKKKKTVEPSPHHLPFPLFPNPAGPHQARSWSPTHPHRVELQKTLCSFERTLPKIMKSQPSLQNERTTWQHNKGKDLMISSIHCGPRIQATGKWPSGRSHAWELQ